MSWCTTNGKKYVCTYSTQFFTQYNANNPKLVVETIVSREEILMHETIFRGLLQKTKDTITKAVKDNLPPEVGEEVTDLVLNVRPVTTEQSKKPSDTTIGKKVRDMLEADSKISEPGSQPQSVLLDAKPSKLSHSNKKPAQLTKNASSLNPSDVVKEDFTIDVSPSTDGIVLKASNRPSTPKTTTKINRVIGSTTVAASVSGTKYYFGRLFLCFRYINN